MLILNIKVMPGARKNLFKKEENLLKVYLSAPAVEGKANKALVEFLAEQFQVRKSAVTITKGLKSRLKTVIIETNLPKKPIG